MDKLLRRSLVTVILLAAVYAVIYVLPAMAFALVVASFAALAQYELLDMAERKGISTYKYAFVGVGFVISAVVYLACIEPALKGLEPFAVVLAIMVCFLAHIFRNNGEKDHLISISVTIFGLIYVVWFFSYFIKLRFMPGGADLVAFLILVTKGADIGAYLGGSKFGKNRLLPHISPNKTREGTISGIIFSTLISITIGRLITGMSLVNTFFLGMILGSIGQIGDLAESLMKRNCQVKDSGGMLADIGGFYDLIDSLLFTAPVFYFYIKLL